MIKAKLFKRTDYYPGSERSYPCAELMEDGKVMRVFTPVPQRFLEEFYVEGEIHGTWFHVKRGELEDYPEETRLKLLEYRTKKLDAVRAQNFEKAANWRTKEIELLNKDQK